MRWRLDPRTCAKRYVRLSVLCGTANGFWGLGQQIDVFLKSSVTAMRSPIFAARGTTPSAARGGSASSVTPTSARRVTSDGAWSQKGGNWNVFYDHFVLHGEAISLFISTGELASRKPTLLW